MSLSPVRKRLQSSDGTPFVFKPLEVLRREQITPHMVRVTFTGDEIQNIRSEAANDDIRIQIPEDFNATPLPPVVSFNPLRLDYPENAHPSQIRAYTIRRIDHTSNELDIDFFVHEGGFASRWAEQAAPGQRVTIGGPHSFTLWDGTIETYILLGDETALPAIGRFVESAGSGTRVTVIAEIETEGEQQRWNTADGVTLDVTWLHQNSANPANLTKAIRALPVPSPQTVIFAAGESQTMRQLRRWMVNEWGIDKRQISIAGYWKHADDKDEYFYEEE